jgi:hypothetical protein
VHLAAFTPLGASVHVPNVRLSWLSVDVNAIVPCGFDCAPVPLSDTVTVIVLPCPTMTVVGFRLTLVVVARAFTFSEADPLLVACTLSLGV